MTALSSSATRRRGIVIRASPSTGQMRLLSRGADGLNGLGEARAPAVVPPMCGGRPATIVGTGALRGTPGPDVIAVWAGTDAIEGRSGNDVLCGGRGRDTLRDGPGHDVVDGGPGRDHVK